MRLSRLWRDADFAILAGLALVGLLLHTLTNGQYGFHRDELATLDDARYLAWGYVAYPPVTPFIGRMALALFGPSRSQACGSSRPWLKRWCWC
jgi:predicted alpha/beta hydrolase